MRPTFGKEKWKAEKPWVKQQEVIWLAQHLTAQPHDG